MPNLTLKSKDGTVRTVALVKRITSVGRSADNDVRLDDPHVAPEALHIVFDGKGHQAESQGEPFQVNGKRTDAHLLQEGDVVRLGDTELTFSQTSGMPAQTTAFHGAQEEKTQDPDAHTRE